LRHRIALLGGSPEPLHRFRIILLHALTVLVADAEVALRLRIALLCGSAHGFKRIP